MISPTASPAVGRPIDLRLSVAPKSAKLPAVSEIVLIALFAADIAPNTLDAAPIVWLTPCTELNRPIIFGSPDTLFI
jgi:hypothetical protein